MNRPSLIPELQADILLRLSDRDLANACATNKEVREICRDDYFWQRRTAIKFPGREMSKPPGISYSSFYKQLALDKIDFSGERIRINRLAAGFYTIVSEDIEEDDETYVLREKLDAEGQVYIALPEERNVPLNKRFWMRGYTLLPAIIKINCYKSLLDDGICNVQELDIKSKFKQGYQEKTKSFFMNIRNTPSVVTVHPRFLLTSEKLFEIGVLSPEEKGVTILLRMIKYLSSYLEELHSNNVIYGNLNARTVLWFVSHIGHMEYDVTPKLINFSSSRYLFNGSFSSPILPYIHFFYPGTRKRRGNYILTPENDYWALALTFFDLIGVDLFPLPEGADMEQFDRYNYNYSLATEFLTWSMELKMEYIKKRLEIWLGGRDPQLIDNIALFLYDFLHNIDTRTNFYNDIQLESVIYLTFDTKKLVGSERVREANIIAQLSYLDKAPVFYSSVQLFSSYFNRLYQPFILEDDRKKYFLTIVACYLLCKRIFTGSTVNLDVEYEHLLSVFPATGLRLGEFKRGVLEQMEEVCIQESFLLFYVTSSLVTEEANGQTEFLSFLEDTIDVTFNSTEKSRSIPGYNLFPLSSYLSIPGEEAFTVQQLSPVPSPRKVVSPVKSPIPSPRRTSVPSPKTPPSPVTSPKRERVKSPVISPREQTSVGERREQRTYEPPRPLEMPKEKPVTKPAQKTKGGYVRPTFKKKTAQQPVLVPSNVPRAKAKPTGKPTTRPIVSTTQREPIMPEPVTRPIVPATQRKPMVPTTQRRGISEVERIALTEEIKNVLSKNRQVQRNFESYARREAIVRNSMDERLEDIKELISEKSSRIETEILYLLKAMEDINKADLSKTQLVDRMKRDVVPRLKTIDIIEERAKDELEDKLEEVYNFCKQINKMFEDVLSPVNIAPIVQEVSKKELNLKYYSVSVAELADRLTDETLEEMVERVLAENYPTDREEQVNKIRQECMDNVDSLRNLLEGSKKEVLEKNAKEVSEHLNALIGKITDANLGVLNIALFKVFKEMVNKVLDREFELEIGEADISKDELVAELFQICSAPIFYVGRRDRILDIAAQLGFYITDEEAAMMDEAELCRHILSLIEEGI
jgi:hypothetical protein